jgi:hypothetical protein
MPVFFSLSSVKALAPQDNSNDMHGHDISFEEAFDGNSITLPDLSSVPYVGD